MSVIGLKLFPTAVYIIKTKQWSKYKDFLLKTIEDTKDPAYRPRDGFYTDYGQEQPWRKVIWGEFLEPHVKALLTETKTKLQDIWSQQYIHQVGHTAHQHQPVGYSCVFYAEFDPEHHWGTTLFRPFLDPNDSLNGDACYTPKVEEGDILVFPSWMLHEVMPSDTQVSRTIIAFNLIAE